MDIREAINALTPRQPWPIVVGTVTRVTDTTADIQPLDDDAPPLLDIDLNVGDTAALSYRPEVGAVVLALLDTPQSGFIVGASSGRIVLNGGKKGGMVNKDDLQDQLSKMTKRIDTIIDALNNCGANTYGGALWSNIKTTLATITEKEDFSQITDDNVTH